MRSNKTIAALWMGLFMHIIMLVNAQQALVPDILPSANATALGKYSQFPVSHYTGQVNIGIPLTSIESHGMKMDFSLSYDGGGIMIDQHPGWVGQNWTLNGGGVITRSVKGRADEEGLSSGGYYYNNRIPYIVTATSLPWFREDSMNIYSELKQVAIRKFYDYYQPIDTEPDIFSFNFLGKTGKFYLAQDGQWKVISDYNIKVEFDVSLISNYQDPFIVYIPGTSNQKKYEKVIKGFKLIDENGYKYTFGYNEHSLEYSLPFFKQYSGGAFGYPNWIATAWHITKIEDYMGNEIFNFSYQRSYFTAQLYESWGPLINGVEYSLGGLH